jgi:hypothetical protein
MPQTIVRGSCPLQLEDMIAQDRVPRIDEPSTSKVNSFHLIREFGQTVK